MGRPPSPEGLCSLAGTLPGTLTGQVCQNDLTTCTQLKYSRWISLSALFWLRRTFQPLGLVILDG